MGGRFDQGFSQIQHLYTATQDESLLKGRIYLVNPESICFILSKGKNVIKTPLGPGRFGPSVGIIPIGRPSTVSTKGLEWDVTGWHTEFGGQLSTSNHIKSDTLEIATSEMVLLSIELDCTVPIDSRDESSSIVREYEGDDEDSKCPTKKQDRRVSPPSHAATSGEENH